MTARPFPEVWPRPPCLRRQREQAERQLKRPALHVSLCVCVYLGLWFMVCLCLHGKEAPRMASVRFTDVQARPTAFLDVTSVTRDKFQQLVPPVEGVFQAPMAA